MSYAPLTYKQSIDFVGDLAAHGNNIAVVTANGESLTYKQLSERVAQFAQDLGSHRRLVAISMRNDIESLVAYLACLHGNHVALLIDADNEAALRNLHDQYKPDTTVTNGNIVHRREISIHELHQDLCLLLSTSGSTGSPKLVRLSHENLQSNAASIAQYLDIRETDRAAANLPLHYCYGLSIINSNFSRGAGVLLSNLSVIDDCFWEMFNQHGGTSIHGVPLTFELLDRVQFPNKSLPSLRYITQAGGRLPADHVKRFAQLCEQRSWKFFVMYGQTEATARMAYLPPELAISKSSSIGIAIPGGSFRIDRDGESNEGELIYTGPNVMMGYAENATDLASARTTNELHTGDIARVDNDGCYQIVGRKSRFLKIAGQRIDLDQLERTLRTNNITGACTGTDDRLVIATTNVERAEQILKPSLKVPRAAVTFTQIADLPRLSNGKVDYQALLKGTETPTKHSHQVRDLFSTSLQIERVEPSDTFISLGGDSLSYVEVSVELERILGNLPSNWERMTIAELESRGHKSQKSRLARVETSVALRAISMFLIVASHAAVFRIVGGAHVLLFLAGWNYSRFIVDRPDAVSATLKAASAIAIPSAAWIAFRSLSQDDIDLRDATLTHMYLGSNTGAWGYWFVETLVMALLFVAAILSFKRMRNIERRSPFLFAAILVAIALPGRMFPQRPETAWEPYVMFHYVVWIFFLGWFAQRGATRNQKLLLVAVSFLLVSNFFITPTRNVVLLAGIVALLFVRTIPMPRPFVKAIQAISSASLAIYLTHYAIFPTVLTVAPPIVATIASLAAGVVIYQCAMLTIAKTKKLLRRAPNRFAWFSRTQTQPTVT